MIPNKFGLRGFNGNWMSATEFTYTESGNFKKFDMVTLVNQTILSKDFLVRFKDYLSRNRDLIKLSFRILKFGKFQH